MDCWIVGGFICWTCWSITTLADPLPLFACSSIRGPCLSIFNQEEEEAKPANEDCQRKVTDKMSRSSLVCCFFFFFFTSLPVCQLPSLPFSFFLCASPVVLIRESSWGQGEWSLSLSLADLLAPQTSFIPHWLIGLVWQLGSMGTKRQVVDRQRDRQTGWKNIARWDMHTGAEWYQCWWGGGRY